VCSGRFGINDMEPFIMGMPLVYRWITSGLPLVTTGLSMVYQRFTAGLPQVYHRFTNVYHRFKQVYHGFTMDSPRFHQSLPILPMFNF
jgi:hypothetical protein